MAKEPEKEPSPLYQRIQRRLVAMGKSAKGASREAELSESFIKNIKFGASKSPRTEGLQALARIPASSGMMRTPNSGCVARVQQIFCSSYVLIQGR